MPQCTNYALKTGQKHAYSTEPEITKHISFSPYDYQLTYIENVAEQEDDMSKAQVIRRLLKKAIAVEQDDQHRIAKDVLERIHAAATDEETRQAVCTLEDKLVNREVEL